MAIAAQGVFPDQPWGKSPSTVATHHTSDTAWPLVSPAAWSPAK
jgi:hypothetical protein